MATHAALASTRIPTNTKFPSKASHSFPTQCASKRFEVTEFSGLRSTSCVTYANDARESSFFDLVASQLTPKTNGSSTPVRGETVAKLKVAINGFGRIGRNFLRCWHGRKDSPLEVVVVNDSGGVKNASHLLKYDSMLGTFKADVKILDNETITVDGKPIKVVSSRDPLKLPWAELGIDIVIEGTGVFVDGPGAGKHIQAGAKKVIITAPAKGADIPTYVVGVNEGDYTHQISNIISNASCTTNCLAPFVKILDEEFGIVKGAMTTTHSYTGDQRLLDASHRDLRRARAAALNIVPTSTGAAKAVSLVLPQLKGKLNGIALRVPTPNVSVVDLVVNVEKKGLTAEDVNAVFRKAAEGPLKGVLDVCDDPLVSIDFRCSDVSSTIDSSLTMVMGDDMVKVVAWYDNEWGYSKGIHHSSLTRLRSKHTQEKRRRPTLWVLHHLPCSSQCRHHRPRRQSLTWQKRCDGVLHCGCFVAFPAVAQAAAAIHDLKLGKQIHVHVFKFGNTPPSSVVVAKSLVNMYGKCGDLVVVRQVFDKIPERDHVLWNSMIAKLCRFEEWELSLHLFQLILSENVCFTYHVF